MRVKGWISALLTVGGLCGLPGLVGVGGADGGWKFVLEFGGEAEDIAVDSRGEVYLVYENRVEVFTSEGQYLRQKTGFLHATGIAIDENDVVYVQERCRVHRYTVDFVPLGSWDTCIGQGDLQAGRALDVQDGLVYIATANSVLKFTTEGAFLGQFPGGGWSDIEIVPDGSVWLVTRFGDQGLVRHYSPEGAVLAEWNTILPGEKESSPRGLAVDSQQRIFTADQVATVKIFTANGILVDRIDVELRVFFNVELDGDDTLYVAAAFHGGVLKFRQKLVAVDASTWGRVKSRHR